jgi:biopolymer transport protein ExbD
MFRKRHYKSKSPPGELDVTTFLSLMVVLIPFLLITAVFSRITIQELSLPDASAGGSDVDEPLVTIEVIVRQDGLEISNGRAVVAAIPLVDGEHDIPTLSSHLRALKERYSEKDDATLLIEPDVDYETIIHVMDAVKLAEVKIEDADYPMEDEGGPAPDLNGQTEDRSQMMQIVLFPRLSIGDAP